jgi:hypothetical protein
MLKRITGMSNSTMARACRITYLWPETPEQEEELENELNQWYPTGDHLMNVLLSIVCAPVENIRLRVMRDAVGWAMFQQMIGEIAAGAFVFLAWSLIASQRHALWASLLYCFLVMQITFSFGVFRNGKVGQAASTVLDELSRRVRISWIMFVAALERGIVTFNALVLYGSLAVLLTISAVASVLEKYGWPIAIMSLAAFLVVTLVRLQGAAGSYRRQFTKHQSFRSKNVIDAQNATVALGVLAIRSRRWFSSTARRPHTGAHLRLPKNHLLLMFSFDVETGLLLFASVCVLMVHWFGDHEPRLVIYTCSVGQARGSSWVQQASRRKTALERPLADRRGI